MFTCFSELAELLGTTVDGLDSFRLQLRYADPANKVITCGDRILIDAPERANFRSQKSRRVAAIFFPKTNPPDLQAHLPGEAIRSKYAHREASAIYRPGSDPFIIIDPHWWKGNPPPRQYTPNFHIEPPVDSDKFILADPDPGNKVRIESSFSAKPGTRNQQFDFVDASQQIVDLSCHLVKADMTFGSLSGDFGLLRLNLNIHTLPEPKRMEVVRILIAADHSKLLIH
jgi:hypothetical protein